MISNQDWLHFQQRLLDASREAIIRFASEYPEQEICYFCFDSEPYYGYVRLAINTTECSQDFARHWRKRHLDYRKKLYDESHDTWIKSSKYQMRSTSVAPFCNNPGDFFAIDCADIEFPEWQAYADSDEYPEHKYGDGSDDYLENRCSYMFWQVFESLSSENLFGELRLATPTYLGFVFHDDEQPTILDVINLP
jgi:hypothetical protein